MLEKKDLQLKATVIRLDIHNYGSIFANTYNQAMDLIERMADYIDGPGQNLSKFLPSKIADLYASEVMATSTRLMQLASWLLLLRSLLEGDLSLEQVTREKANLCLTTSSQCNIAEGWAQLPPVFKDIVQESLNLEARIRTMDERFNKDQNGMVQPNYVHQQYNELCKFFANT